MADWNAEASIQIGDPQGPPWPHLGAFLDGFAAGVQARGARGVAVVSSRAGVRFRFEAPPDEEQAQRMAEDVFFRAGLESGVDSVPAEGQPFGWGASTEIWPADVDARGFRAGRAARATTFVRRVVRWWRRGDDSAARPESQRP